MNDSEPSQIPEMITAYSEVFENLTEETMPDLLALASDDIVFTDPFNKVFGKEGFEAIFRHMFETCEDPVFIVSDLAAGNQAWYLRWRMTGRLRSWPRTSLALEGMSEVRLDEAGLISHHIDHWDSASQLLTNLPLIGAVMRFILKIFRVGS